MSFSGREVLFITVYLYKWFKLYPWNWESEMG